MGCAYEMLVIYLTEGLSCVENVILSPEYQIHKIV